MTEVARNDSVDICTYVRSRWTWPVAMVEKLTALWEVRPMMSTWEIARELGVTKNAVVGKRKRLNLPERQAGGNGGRPLKPSTARRREREATGGRSTRNDGNTRWRAPQPDCEAGAAVDLPADTSPTAIEIRDLTPTVCHYPLWPTTERSGLYCGATSFGELPYCARHCRVVYRASSERNA